MTQMCNSSASKQQVMSDGTLQLASQAVFWSPLLHSCVLGFVLNWLGVPLTPSMDECFDAMDSPFKVLLYFLVGFYADFDITVSDIKLLAYFSLQRGVIQAVLGCFTYFVLPWSSVKDKQAVTLAIFSPIVSIT